MAEDLPQLVRRWVADRRGSDELLRRIRCGIVRATARHPDAWFEQGRKDEASLDSLASRVFVSCDQRPRAGAPYLGRVPFVAFAQDRTEDRQINWAVIWGPRSVTREEMKEDYQKNIRRDPVLWWKAKLYRALGEVLAEVAEPTLATPGRGTTWRLPGGAPGRVRNGDEVADEMKRSRLPLAQARTLDRATLKELTTLALRLSGAGLTRSKLCHALVDVIGAPTEGGIQSLEEELGEEPVAEEPDPEQLATARAMLQQRFALLDPPDQALARDIALGEDPEQLMARHGQVGSRAALSRRLNRISEVLLDPLEDAVQSLAGQGPQRRVEVFVSLLISLEAA